MRLDDYFANDKTVDFIKMDIEGAEIEAIEGAKNLLERSERVKLAVCAYHRQNDEESIKRLFADDTYSISHSRGYMNFWGIPDYKAPCLRRGVLRIVKK